MVHTMCVNKAEDCINGEIIWSGLDDEGRKSILDMHNKLRNKHAGGGEDQQPKAADMLKMVWSEELENVSVYLRIGGHSECKQHSYDFCISFNPG